MVEFRRFRAIPVEVEAVQVTAEGELPDGVRRFLNPHSSLVGTDPICTYCKTPWTEHAILPGKELACVGEWIVKMSDGIMEVWSDRKMESNYEEIA